MPARPPRLACPPRLASMTYRKTKKMIYYQDMVALAKRTGSASGSTSLSGVYTCYKRKLESKKCYLQKKSGY